MINEIIRSRCGGKVERCHTIPHNGSYNNAAHSWGVAMLMYYIWPEDFPRLAIYCLSHDIGEGWMGDVPAPALWAMGKAREHFDNMEGDLQEAAGCPREDALLPEDLAKLKACDRLELYIWCREQMAMGNMYVKDCEKALRFYFRDNPLPEPAMSLCADLIGMKDEAYTPTQQGVVQELMDIRNGRLKQTG